METSMTLDEFNTKYAQWLEEGHYGLDIDNPAVIEFLDELFEDYLTKIEGFFYTQIKLKYDYSRFYFVIDAETACYHTNQALEFLVENTINMLVAKDDD
jgi:hypothetical protein